MASAWASPRDTVCGARLVLLANDQNPGSNFLEERLQGVDGSTGQATEFGRGPTPFWRHHDDYERASHRRPPRSALMEVLRRWERAKSPVAVTMTYLMFRLGGPSDLIHPVGPRSTGCRAWEVNHRFSLKSIVSV